MLGSHALHLVAWVALRARSPRTAMRIVDLAGRFLPALDDADAARRVASRLRGGTCLSRAMAVAARLPNAEVVIGVREGGARDVDAHAWIELGREPIDPTQVAGAEIARLASRRRA
jgi:hypothetical protein